MNTITLEFYLDRFSFERLKYLVEEKHLQLEEVFSFFLANKVVPTPQEIP